jgi:hypothetical protein
MVLARQGEMIMSNTISVRELATEARRLAQDEPDRKAVCSYVRYDEDGLVPNCIVGQAAFNLGISLDELLKVNTCGIRHLATFIKPEWLSVGENDDVHVAWLGALQGAQDGGETWGDALRIADRRTTMNQFNI